MKIYHFRLFLLRKSWLLVYGLGMLFYGTIDAQVLLQGSFNARAAGLGNIVTVQKGEHSLGANLAGGESLEGFAANTFLSQRFLSADLNIIGMAAAIPTNTGTFGLTVRHLGFDLWREQMAGVSYARQLAKGLSFGGQIDYYHLDLKEYGNQSTFTFELGLQLELSSDVLLGLYTVNPVRAGLTEDEILPSFLALGIAYRLNESLDLLGEVQQTLQGSTDLKFGLAYKIIEALEAQLGFQSKASVFSFGLSYQSNYGLQLGMAMNYHQVLGLTPSVGVVFYK